MACEISLNIIDGIAESWRLFCAYTRKLLISIMLCDWLKLKLISSCSFLMAFMLV